MFTVAKAIPVPRPKRKGHALTYNWDDMNPGDSFFIPVDAVRAAAYKRAASNTRSSAHNNFIQWRNEDTSRAHYKIVTRMWTDNDVSGVRVWLMEK